MTKLISKELLDEAKKHQRQHVEDMSREITIVTGDQLTEECPNCHYDTVAGTSAASYTGLAGVVTVFSGTAYEQTFEAKNFRQRCPVCNGVGSFSVPMNITVLAHIYWDEGIQGSTYPNTPVGLEGQNSVKIKTHSDHYTDFVRADSFVVDGVVVLPSSSPVIRSIGQKDGIVEIWCKTHESGNKDITR